MGCSQKALVLVHPALLSVFGGSVCWAGDRFALVLYELQQYMVS